MTSTERRIAGVARDLIRKYRLKPEDCGKGLKEFWLKIGIIPVCSEVRKMNPATQGHILSEGRGEYASERGYSRIKGLTTSLNEVFEVCEGFRFEPKVSGSETLTRLAGMAIVAEMYDILRERRLDVNIEEQRRQGVELQRRRLEEDEQRNRRRDSEAYDPIREPFRPENWRNNK